MSEHPFKNYSIGEIEECLSSALRELFKNENVKVGIDRLTLDNGLGRYASVELQVLHVTDWLKKSSQVSAS